MNTSTLLENQLLATKFFAPVAPGTLISRPRLTTLLDQSFEHPLTLISASAGFGKTTLLADWTQSLPPNHPRMAWISLDEEDNEPRLFWMYVLTALSKQQPEHFTPLLVQLQSPQIPSLRYILTTLINLLAENTDHLLLILDDYQVISEQNIHQNLLYLIQNLPLQLHIIISTRADPPLSLPHLRARGRILEVRTNQLRCTVEETAAFFKKVMDIQLSNETIQEVTTRTEGWLVGLQLLTLSLPEQANPLSLLKEVSGDQRYILDYLTEQVLQRLPQEVQTFLLSTSILEQLTASLCDAIVQQSGSRQILQWLEQANLFVVSLDRKREWYRYHALFAQTLRYYLDQTQHDLVPALHYRASLWYAEHNHINKAVLHAFSAHQWHWAADLVERISVITANWSVNRHTLVLFRQWLEQLPADVLGSRPRLCLTCAQMLWTVAPYPLLKVWLDAAEARLSEVLRMQIHEEVSPTILVPQARNEQENLLGEVIAWRAFLLSLLADEAVPSLCQQALTLLSAENCAPGVVIGATQLHSSFANDAVASVHSGLQAGSLALKAGQLALAIAVMGATAMLMIPAGQLQKAQQLTRQAIQLGRKPEGHTFVDVGWPSVFQAEILREWNQLDAALDLAREAISLCEQTPNIGISVSRVCGYMVLLHICLSREELEMARSVLEQVESICMGMNQLTSLYFRSFYTIVDQVRLWLACGELDRATDWVEEQDRRGPHGTPVAREREEVARVRILLAKHQPTPALQRLEPVLQRATAGQRWGHVIEIRLLQALTHQMLNQEKQALCALSEAVRLGEPEGYIRSFVDEGASAETLLYQLRKRDRKNGPTPYLDTLLAAFQQESLASTQKREPIKAQSLPEPLSERELQVLQLLTRGASNQKIAQELVIVVDTVKRHISHIFSKLGVRNRVQAIRQAQELGLLGEDF